MDPVTLLFGLGLGLLVGAVLRALWGLWGYLPTPSSSSPDAAYAWDPARERPTTSPPDLPDHADLAADPAPVPTPRLTIEVRPPPEVGAPRDRGRPGRPELEPPAPATIRISQRVIAHLARLGRYGPDEVAPPGATQAGMTAALGIRQGSLTKVLAQLVAGGALAESKSHVQGGPRRLKVYRLTALGEAIARDLRRSGVTAPPPEAPRPPAP